jgi:acid stress-induced BolA-like protein IbaG/YrbA
MMKVDELDLIVARIADHLQFTEKETKVEQQGRWFHVLIVAAEFRGKSQGERENVIWREFERRLDDETILSITQCYLLTPEEQESMTPLTAS